MVEAREDLTLTQEALREVALGRAAAQALERDVLLERTVRALRTPDDAHATSTERLDEPEWTDDVAGLVVAESVSLPNGTGDGTPLS